MRPKSTGHAIGSLIFVAVAVVVNDLALFGPTTRADPLSVGWEIAIWVTAVTITIGLVWMAYENWFGRM